MKDINFRRFEDSIFLKKVSSKSEVLVSDDSNGYLIESNEIEARKIIDSLKGKGKIIALGGGDDAFNRRAVETLKINYLISPEKHCVRKSLKQIDSGMNHVVAKEAKKKGISIVFDFGEISKLGPREKADRISRLLQNVRVCRKAKCDVKIASFAEREEDLIDERGRQAFGVSLGMSSEQIKNCVIF